MPTNELAGNETTAAKAAPGIAWTGGPDGASGGTSV